MKKKSIWIIKQHQYCLDNLSADDYIDTIVSIHSSEQAALRKCQSLNKQYGIKCPATNTYEHEGCCCSDVHYYNVEYHTYKDKTWKTARYI